MDVLHWNIKGKYRIEDKTGFIITARSYDIKQLHVTRVMILFLLVESNTVAFFILLKQNVTCTANRQTNTQKQSTLSALC